MKRYFICLANSKKYGERCIAGIEMTGNQKNQFDILKEEEKAKWIRPVSDAEHGQVPEYLVKDMKLFDIYEIEVKEDCPKDYQSENCLFDARSLKLIKSVPLTEHRLDLLCSNTDFLFDDNTKSVTKENIAKIGYSLLFVKVENPIVYEQDNKEKNASQLRIHFIFKEIHYDMPITDVVFLNSYQENVQAFRNATTVYVCVSLGIEFQERYYKLAAGIFYL